MYNANVLACYVSNVSIVWFYTLIITILIVFIINTYCSNILLSFMLLGLRTCWN